MNKVKDEAADYAKTIAEASQTHACFCVGPQNGDPVCLAA
jgi:hypothetical protein